MTTPPPAIHLTQHQVAAALVQHLGRLGQIPAGWEASVSFDSGPPFAVSITMQPPAQERQS